MDLIEELTWRGLLSDLMPGTQEHLNKASRYGYAGFDPSSDSLHVGNLVPVMLLTHLQRAGHIPIVLVGGATGMVGDPSGKSAERNLLPEETLRNNERGIQKQLEKLLNFGNVKFVNNYDWFKSLGFLEFIRDTGKHITVNYMLSKESVQKRLETGISFTEFTYQLIQGYDYYKLFSDLDCTLQIGGSDQWGNILTGTELIRRKAGGEAFGLTAPLITKSDGSKFGKSEQGNVWLDPEKTSPYQFYQFWLNVSDSDASRYIRVFTLLGREEIEQLEAEHQQKPHERLLQRALAKDLTTRVHSEEAWQQAVSTAGLLFGQGTTDMLKAMSERQILDVFEGVPHFTVRRELVESGIGVIDLLAVETQVFPSKGEARKMIQAGGVSVNKEKVSGQDQVFDQEALLQGKYLLVQKGKKQYFLVIAE